MQRTPIDGYVLDMICLYIYFFMLIEPQVGCLLSQGLFRAVLPPAHTMRLTIRVSGQYSQVPFEF